MSGTALAPQRPRSEITARAVAFVASHKPAAEDLGRRLADELDDPDRFAAVLSEGFAGLADPEYHEGQHMIVPTLGRSHGVRWPLIQAVNRGFRQATRGERTTRWLFVADRLFREPEIEARWFAFGLFDRLVADEPERTWQLMRRAAREAEDWATVDALAHPYGRGILNEPYRWAELDQLVYSPSHWERRLVGSTVATAPFIDRRRGREEVVADHGLDLIGQLIGDDSPDVQKALAWALRSLVLVDADAVRSFCEAEADRAASTNDGHRAWVIRDALPKLDAETGDVLRKRLGGIRRRPNAPNTSRAAEAAKRFGGEMLGRPLPEPPLM
jgi:3-methyladenine DNA glycosylase AlkD